MPIPKELIYEGEYTIRTYEIDADKTVTIASLINLMQEAAMQNVIDIKLSVWDLAEQQISWVLLRKNLQIIQLPKLNDTIRVVTHPAGFDRLFTYRDYRVFDSQDNLIAFSSSTWLLMNTETRAAAKIPDTILTRGQFDTSDCLVRPKSKLARITSPKSEKTFRVNWHDLDFNAHLSNIRYMQWMFETVDYYTQNQGKLKELNIVYKAEGHLHDEIKVQTQPIDKNTFLHQLIRLSDEKQLATAQTFWEVY
jgi:acyl-ACP thioesterase